MGQFVYFAFFCVFGVFSVVYFELSLISASDYMERLVSEMTYYVSAIMCKTLRIHTSILTSAIRQRCKNSLRLWQSAASME